MNSENLTLSVEIVTPEGYTHTELTTKSERKAIATARRVAAINKDNFVFITWGRASDGQNGYLNPDGNYAITGKAWH
jgi:hypothetical protein